MVPSAEEQIFKALAIFESLGDQNGQGVAYRKIAQIYIVTEAPERALEYDRRALELLKATEDHYNTCLSLMNMTMSYNQLKEYDEALAAADECLQILEDENMDQFGIEARMYAFRGDSYRDLKNYDAAEADYTKASEIIKSVVGEERATEWEMSIAEVKATRPFAFIEKPFKIRSLLRTFELLIEQIIAGKNDEAVEEEASFMLKNSIFIKDKAKMVGKGSSHSETI